jgi:hypothetical protein
LFIVAEVSLEKGAKKKPQMEADSYGEGLCTKELEEYMSRRCKVMGFSLYCSGE